MRTVLFTHPSAELYGADRTLLDAVRATVAAGRHAVVALPRRGVLASRLEELGAVVEVGELGAALRADLAPRRFPAFLGQARAGARFVAEIVERHRVDLVHTNTTVLVGAAFGAHRARVPHLWHVHEILDEPRWASRTLRTLLHRWSDLLVVNSEATRRAMTDPRSDAVRVVHNGFDPERFRIRGPFDRARLLERHGLPADGRFVIAPGRINSWKGQGILVEALGRARAALRDVHVAFVGDAPPGQPEFTRRLEEAIAREGLAEKVSIVPFTEELPALLRAADLCVVPSTRPEPFGLVALEAHAAGTAVLAAGHGGLTEIVETGRTGELFFPGCPDDLAAQLTSMLGIGFDLAELGANAYERARAHFALEAYERGITQAHAHLLGDRTRAVA